MLVLGEGGCGSCLSGGWRLLVRLWWIWGDGLESDVILQKASLLTWCTEKFSLPEPCARRERELGLARIHAGAVSAVVASRLDGSPPVGPGLWRFLQNLARVAVGTSPGADGVVQGMI